MSKSRNILAYALWVTRMMRGMTQQELADKLNKTTNAVSNWENGHTSPPVSVLVDLCKVLKVTPNQLLGFEEIEGFIEFETKLKEQQQQISDLEKQKREIEKQIKEIKSKGHRQ
jgi:transcriptional regulator with XRE-family HTH domain